MNMKQMKSTNKIFERWIPREQVRAFFGYGQTKMCSFSSDYNVRSKKVGNKLMLPFIITSIARINYNNINGT